MGSVPLVCMYDYQEALNRNIICCHDYQEALNRNIICCHLLFSTGAGAQSLRADEYTPRNYTVYRNFKVNFPQWRLMKYQYPGMCAVEGGSRVWEKR